MKLRSLLTLTAAFAALTLATFTPANAAIPNPGYQYGYDPGTGLLPNNPALTQPAWGTHFVAGSSRIEGGVLVMDTPATQYHIYRMYGGNPGGDNASWNHNLSLGSTVEFRARVRAGSTSTANRFQIITGANTFNLDFGLGNFAGQAVDTSVFHTFRIDVMPVSVEAPKGIARLYLDDEYLTTLTGTGTGISGNYMEFGNGFGILGGGVVEYAFIQWTNAGVLPEPSVVPEPSTALLSGAGLLLLALTLRRRN